MTNEKGERICLNCKRPYKEHVELVNQAGFVDARLCPAGIWKSGEKR